MARTIYISPIYGNDENTGLVNSFPLRTIDKAEELYGNDLTVDTTVYLACGEIFTNVTRPWTPESGAKVKFTYWERTVGDIDRLGRPVISGGTKLTDWVQYSPTLWYTDQVTLPVVSAKTGDGFLPSFPYNYYVAAVAMSNGVVLKRRDGLRDKEDGGSNNPFYTGTFNPATQTLAPEEWALDLSRIDPATGAGVQRIWVAIDPSLHYIEVSTREAPIVFYTPKNLELNGVEFRCATTNLLSFGNLSGINRRIYIENCKLIGSANNGMVIAGGNVIAIKNTSILNCFSNNFIQSLGDIGVTLIENCILSNYPTFGTLANGYRYDDRATADGLSLHGSGGSDLTIKNTIVRYAAESCIEILDNYNNVVLENIECYGAGQNVVNTSSRVKITESKFYDSARGLLFTFHSGTTAGTSGYPYNPNATAAGSVIEKSIIVNCGNVDKGTAGNSAGIDVQGAAGSSPIVVSQCRLVGSANAQRELVVVRSKRETRATDGTITNGTWYEPCEIHFYNCTLDHVNGDSGQLVSLQPTASGSPPALSTYKIKMTGCTVAYGSTFVRNGTSKDISFLTKFFGNENNVIDDISYFVGPTPITPNQVVDYSKPLELQIGRPYAKRLHVINAIPEEEPVDPPPDYFHPTKGKWHTLWRPDFLLRGNKLGANVLAANGTTGNNIQLQYEFDGFGIRNQKLGVNAGSTAPVTNTTVTYGTTPIFAIIPDPAEEDSARTCGRVRATRGLGLSSNDKQRIEIFNIEDAKQAPFGQRRFESLEIMLDNLESWDTMENGGSAGLGGDGGILFQLKGDDDPVNGNTVGNPPFMMQLIRTATDGLHIHIQLWKHAPGDTTKRDSAPIISYKLKNLVNKQWMKFVFDVSYHPSDDAQAHFRAYLARDGIDATFQTLFEHETRWGWPNKNPANTNGYYWKAGWYKPKEIAFEHFYTSTTQPTKDTHDMYIRMVGTIRASDLPGWNLADHLESMHAVTGETVPTPPENPGDPVDPVDPNPVTASLLHPTNGKWTLQLRADWPFSATWYASNFSTPPPNDTNGNGMQFLIHSKYNGGNQWLQPLGTYTGNTDKLTIDSVDVIKRIADPTDTSGIRKLLEFDVNRYKADGTTLNFGGTNAWRTAITMADVTKRPNWGEERWEVVALKFPQDYATLAEGDAFTVYQYNADEGASILLPPFRVQVRGKTGGGGELYAELAKSSYPSGGANATRQDAASKVFALPAAGQTVYLVFNYVTGYDIATTPGAKFNMWYAYGDTGALQEGIKYTGQWSYPGGTTNKGHWTSLGIIYNGTPAVWSGSAASGINTRRRIQSVGFGVIRPADATGISKEQVLASIKSGVTVITPDPPAPPDPTWVEVAKEWGNFTINPGPKTVRFGTGSSWIEKSLTGTWQCNFQTFGGDPAVGQSKVCQVYQTDVVTPPPVTGVDAWRIPPSWADWGQVPIPSEMGTLTRRTTSLQIWENPATKLVIENIQFEVANGPGIVLGHGVWNVEIRNCRFTGNGVASTDINHAAILIGGEATGGITKIHRNFFEDNISGVVWNGDFSKPAGKAAGTCRRAVHVLGNHFVRQRISYWGGSNHPNQPNGSSGGWIKGQQINFTRGIGYVPGVGVSRAAGNVIDNWYDSNTIGQVQGRFSYIPTTQKNSWGGPIHAGPYFRGTTDQISIFECSGEAGNYVDLDSNIIIGGGWFNGTGIIIGDSVARTTQYVRARRNRIYRTHNNGIQIAGGLNHVITGNFIDSAGTKVEDLTHVPIAVRLYAGKVNPGGHSITNNVVCCYRWDHNDKGAAHPGIAVDNGVPNVTTTPNTLSAYAQLGDRVYKDPWGSWTT